MDVVDWTAANGFESIEIACWPRTTGPTRRYAGTSHIDVANLSADAGDATSSARSRRRAWPSPASATTRTRSIPIPTHRARGHRPPQARHHRRREDGRAARQHVHGRRRREDPGRRTGTRPSRSGRTSCRFAQDHGRKITIENCPMLFSHDEWPGGHNLATTPRIWRRILEQWGGTIGLNFDPSHLILQMIDIPRFIGEFGPHILHVQAKDLLIDRDGLYERGVFSLGIGWQVPRLPGPRRRRLGPAVRRAVARRLRRRRDHRARGSRLREDRRPRQARLPARPRRPPPVHQVSGHDRACRIETLTYRDVAKTIDHSLLRPELDDAFVEAGCRLAAAYDVASVCVRPADVSGRGPILDGHGRRGRHGRSASRTATTGPRPRSSRRARRWPTARPSSTWSSRSAPSSPAATPRSRPTSRPSSRSPMPAGAIVKVIFENAYLTDDEKVRACRLTEAAGGDFVKTSTGFAPSGATHDDLRLMRANTLAAHPGQGRRRRPDARRAARGHGARRDPGRRDRDADDPRRLPGAQRRGGRAPAVAAPTGSRTEDGY